MILSKAAIKEDFPVSEKLLSYLIKTTPVTKGNPFIER